MSDIEEARAQLREIIRELIRLLYHLLGVAAALPVTPQEVSPDDFGDRLSASEEVRAVIQNAVNDRLRPMIEDLRAIVNSPPPSA